jgi:hypothetical protein
MKKYCDLHPSADICSCYLPAPSFTPPAINGLAQCWNKKCADYGYVPKNMRQSCPNITICTQDMTTSGNNNALTSNVIVQNCSSATNGQNTSGATVQGGTLNMNAGAQTQGMNKTYIWNICIILVAGITFLLIGSDESSSKVERRNDYPSNQFSQVYQQYPPYQKKA